MKTINKFALACALGGSALLPASGFTAMVSPAAASYHADREAIYASASRSGLTGIYYRRLVFMPIDLRQVSSLPAQGGSDAQAVSRHHMWQSGQGYFMHPRHGHGHMYEVEGREIEDLHHGVNPVPLPAPWTMLLSGLLLAATGVRGTMRQRA